MRCNRMRTFNVRSTDDQLQLVSTARSDVKFHEIFYVKYFMKYF